MKRRYRLSPKAVRDLLRIWTFTQEGGGIDVADRVQSVIISKIGMLSENPDAGHWRPDLTAAPVRFFAVYSYLVIYRPETKPLQIVTIVHGNRDVRRLLKNT